MKLKFLIIALLVVVFSSFQQKNENSIKGIWTDKSTENATFQIKEKTIYYVDDFATYKYTFKNNIIKIYYSDYTFEGRVSFFKGVMIIKSSDGTISKYYRFRN